MCKFCGCHGSKPEKQVLKVEGMSCGHCKAAVEKAVRGLPGVLAAEVDLGAKTLSIEYDSKKITIGAIKDAIDDAGYQAV